MNQKAPEQSDRQTRSAKRTENESNTATTSSGGTQLHSTHLDVGKRAQSLPRAYDTIVSNQMEKSLGRQPSISGTVPGISSITGASPSDDVFRQSAAVPIPRTVVQTPDLSDARTPVGSEQGDYLQTPIGEGIHHRLESYNSPIKLLPQKPSHPHIESCLQGLKERIGHFGESFNNRTGGRGEFETKASNFTKELEEVEKKCLEMGYTDLLKKVYLLTGGLETMQKMQLPAGSKEVQNQQSTRQATGSQHHLTVLEQSVNYSSNTAQKARRYEHLTVSAHTTDDSDREGINMESDEDDSRATRIKDPPSIRASIKNLRTQFSTLEKDWRRTKEKEVKLNLNPRVKDLENFIDKEFASLKERVLNQENFIGEELASLNDRVLTQENFKLNERVINQETVISELKTKLTASVAVCQNYEEMAKGLSKDITQLKNEMKAHNNKINEIRSANLSTNTLNLRNGDQCSLQLDRSDVTSQIHLSTIPGGISGNVTPVMTTLLEPRTGLTSSTWTTMATSAQPSRFVTQPSVPYSVPLYVGQPGVQSQTGLAPNIIGQSYIQLPDGSFQVIHGTQANWLNNPVITPTNPTPQPDPQPTINAGTQPQEPSLSDHGNTSFERTASNSSSAGSLTNTDNLCRLGMRLKKAGKELRKLLSPPVDEKLTRSTVQSIHKSVLIAVDSDRKEVLHLLEKYESQKLPPPNTELLNLTEDILDDAKAWSHGMREKHRELDCDKRPLEAKLYDGLKRFSKDSEVNIFEFLRRFELSMEEQGTAKEKAALLYEQHLSKEIQLELIDRKDSYEMMRRWLIRKFGDVKVITGSILKTIAKENLPNENTQPAAVTNYYRMLNSIIKKVQELRKTTDMPREELDAHIYSSEFIAKLISLVPVVARRDFMNKLMEEGEDPERIQGNFAFSLLSSTVYKYFCVTKGNESIEIASGLAKPSKKNESPQRIKKNVHTAQVHNSEDEETVPCCHVQSSKPQRKAPKDGQIRDGQIKGGQLKDGQTRANLEFPCFLNNHKHQIGECDELFSMSVNKRRRFVYKRACYTCLLHYKNCINGCANMKAVIAASMICPECWAGKNKKNPTNILLCKEANHTKPDNATLMNSLKKYLKKFDATKIQGTINLTAHLQIAAHSGKCGGCKLKTCNCIQVTKTSKVDPAANTPSINTNTGDKLNIPDSKIITESDHESFYVMQLLNMGDKTVLAFFDRGANQHLIEGQLAEDLQLKVVSEKPINIGVVGGGSICTEYGTYAVSIGPTEDGMYHRITAQGIKSITAPFPYYDLTEINKETRKSGLMPGKNAALPEYIGGQRASLLIGIKNTGLDPVQLFQLPSGLSVFKSPLKDKFGSRLCYGGPHSLFTSVNKSVGSVSHLNAFYIDMISQYRNSVYPALSNSLQENVKETCGGIMFVNDDHIRYRYKTVTGMEINPTAVSNTDLDEMGEPTLEPANIEEETCICSPLNNPLPCTVINAVHKAKIPISKRKQYVDEEDMAFADGYRCETCAQCKKCLVSDRTKMMSLQETIEQEAIEKSVQIDLENGRVYVDLPFIKPPVPALKKRHNEADNNFYQALRIYKTQCRKSEESKAEMRKVHKDLVERGFMKKLSNLNPQQQSIVKNAEFKHYMPWRTAEKANSVSTPYRMVVDASVTGLNEILAKGVNNMAKINDILIRNRCRTNVWSSDISKMYNQLHLQDTALPYGLFLFDEKLDPDTEPEIYCMVVAWYGVTSTGNQGGEALERLVMLQAEEFPNALNVVKNDRYVDDIFSGDNSDEAIEEQIEETSTALAKGGFNFKYVVKSGKPPCAEASPDGKALSILGYSWAPEEDIFKPGFQQLNFNKKHRGKKAVNPFPVKTPSDVTKLLESTKITRRMVVSKIAELWDPIGLWEPYKLQLKLDSHVLNGLDWDVELEPDLQTHWLSRFQQFLEIPNMETARCVIPKDAVDPGKIRLICLSDAAESAGGCAIYAGFLRQNGSYSCKLLTSRSKLLNQKIPRNELEGIKLMAETTAHVKDALGDSVTEVLYFTDSTIAMCWCHNLSKKLRMFTLYRVADVRRSIKRVTGLDDTEPLPLFHIDGKLNIADLLTKPNKITPRDINLDSEWQNGLAWMTLPTSEMPFTTYADLTVTKEEEDVINIECFPEPILSATDTVPHSAHFIRTTVADAYHCRGCKGEEVLASVQTCYGCNDQLDHCDMCKCDVKFSSFALSCGRVPLGLDIIKFGWIKSIRYLATIAREVANFMHRFHKKKGELTKNNCPLCRAIEDTNNDATECGKIFREHARNLLFRQESTRVKSVLPAKKLESLVEVDGILYFESRLSEENPVTQKDLDFDIFFDNKEIKSLLPVVLADSELFFAYTMYIHNVVRPHSGVETTLREIMKTMYVLKKPRRIIQRVRRDCSRCRIIAKKTLELKMANHPAARTELAPPFYHCQIDTVYGFKGQPYKNARKSFKIYALLIVCLLTGATSILAMEGLETQDVIQALERHSSRHGVPAVIYVDNGTQLVALENAQYSIRNLKAQVQDTLGLQVKVSTAKSHEARGRVEAKVRILRTMLDKLAVNTDACMTAVQWETLFLKISNQIDDLPIAKSDSSNVKDLGWDIITANCLKLGRNNNRSLEGSINLTKGSGLSGLLRRNQDIQAFWYQMFLDKIHHLIPRSSKWSKTDKINVGDICLFTMTENITNGKDGWKIGKIVEVPSRNKVVIQYPGNSKAGIDELPQLKKIVRSPRNISIISVAGEVDLNSRKYYEQLTNG